MESDFKPISLNIPSIQKEAKGVKNIDDTILQPNFVTLIVGKPGSGKSHLLREFILNKQLYNKKFGFVLFITPSYFEDPEIKLDSDNHSKFLDVEWIYKKIEDYRKFIDDKYKDTPQPCKNVLIIFDDVIGDLKKQEKDPRLISLFYNRRHILGDKFMISIIVTTQKYVLCPPKLRSVITSVIAFPLMKMDWQKLESECIFDTVDKRWIAKMYQDFNKEKYAFIYIRLDNGKIFYKFDKCLNSI